MYYRIINIINEKGLFSYLKINIIEELKNSDINRDKLYDRLQFEDPILLIKIFE